MSRGGKVESLAVIDDAQRQRLMGSRDRQDDPPGVAMRDRVSHRFLADPEDAERQVLGHVVEVACRGEGHLHVVAPLDFDTVRLQRGNQPDVAQSRGVQVVGDPADVFDQADRSVLISDRASCAGQS